MKDKFFKAAFIKILRWMAMKEILMVYLLEISKTVWDLDLEFLGGTMEKSLREIGRMEWKVGKEFGDLLKVTPMKVNGSLIGNMAKEFLNTKRALTKENLRIFWKMEKVVKYFQMGINMKDNI